MFFLVVSLSLSLVFFFCGGGVGGEGGVPPRGLRLPAAAAGGEPGAPGLAGGPRRLPRWRGWRRPVVARERVAGPSPGPQVPRPRRRRRTWGRPATGPQGQAGRGTNTQGLGTVPLARAFGFRPAHGLGPLGLGTGLASLPSGKVVPAVGSPPPSALQNRRGLRHLRPRAWATLPAGESAPCPGPHTGGRLPWGGV